MNDIDRVEYRKLLFLDWVEVEHLLFPDTEYCCGEMFGFWCGFGDHLIIQHYWNTGNKQTMRLEI